MSFQTFASTIGLKPTLRERTVEEAFTRYTDSIIINADVALAAYAETVQSISEVQDMVARLALLLQDADQTINIARKEPDGNFHARSTQTGYWTAILDAHKDRLPEFDASVAVFAAFSAQIIETAMIAEFGLHSMRRLRKNVFHTGFYWESWSPTNGSVALTAKAMNQSAVGFEHGRKVAKLEREQKSALYD